MRMASHSACSSTRHVKTSGAAAAMPAATRARCVGVHTFGGASTMYLRAPGALFRPFMVPNPEPYGRAAASVCYARRAPGERARARTGSTATVRLHG